jgi:hypothetical protein
MDWYCTDVALADKTQSTYCFPSSDVCEYKRTLIVKKRWGKPGACVAQQTAFCLQISDVKTMNRKTMCARRMEDCEKARKAVIDDPQKFSGVSVCKPTSNIDSFEKPTELFDSDGFL